MLALVVTGTAYADQETRRVYLAGQIDRLPIQMELNSATAEGWYFYQNRGASMQLTGTNRAGNLQLEERSPGGKITGFVNLRWSGAQRLAGTWQSADRKKQLPVSLDLVAKYVEHRDDFPEGYSHTRLTWPIFVHTNTGLARFLNTYCQTELRQRATRFRQLCRETLAEVKKESGGIPPLYGYYLVAGYNVCYASSNYVSLVKHGWEAWGDGGTSDRDESLNYVWQNGKPVQVKLPTLLRTAQSSAQLVEMIVRDMRRQLGTNASQAYLPLRPGDTLELQPWAWRPGGLVFFFKPEEFFLVDGGPSEVFLDRAGSLRPVLKSGDALKELGLPAN